MPAGWGLVARQPETRASDWLEAADAWRRGGNVVYRCHRITGSSVKAVRKRWGAVAWQWTDSVAPGALVPAVRELSGAGDV